MRVKLKKTGSWNIKMCSLTGKYFLEKPKPLSATTNLGHCLILLYQTCSNFSSIYTSICDCLLFYFIFTQHYGMLLPKTSTPIFGINARDKSPPRIADINHLTQSHIPEVRHVHASTPNVTKDVWSETVT